MADKKDKKEEKEEKEKDKKDEKPKDAAGAKEGKEGKEGEAGAEGAEGAEGEAPKKKSKKKLIIMVAVGVLVIGGIVGGLLASGILGGGEEAKPGEGKEEHGKDEHGKEVEKGEKEHGGDAKKEGGHGKEGEVEAPAYVDLPNIVVNLSSASGRPHFVNLKIALELASKEDGKLIEGAMPKIQDSLNTYLRDIRKEDLNGSAGTERLKIELKNRFDKILGEGKVKDILFKEIIVQ